MIAAIYARKSTSQADVADEAKSVTRQVDAATAFITAKGWDLDERHIFVDDGISGALFANREEFQRMMREAAAGGFGAVVFYDLDRFGRQAHKTMVALNALADLDVTVWDCSTGREVDLNSFEGRVSTTLRAEFAQQYREDIRKKTKEAMRFKASQGLVTGGVVYGYINHRLGKGQVERRIHPEEAAIVREIYGRAADGVGIRGIADALNRRKVPSPRAQQGRPSGWSASTVRAVLERPLYRGEIVFGRQAKAYGRELGKARTLHGQAREKGMIDRPVEAWLRREAPALRIIDPDLAARVDARRSDRRSRYLASVAKGGRVPERAHGKYLLSGGMLICPTCGGHFEARIRPWKGVRDVYICSTRRRKPGVCTNTLALPMQQADEEILTAVENRVLSPALIEELLAEVDGAHSHEGQHLDADRARLQMEISNLLDLAASGVSADTIAPKIRERQTARARVEVHLRTPRQAPPNIDALRAALEQRTAEWKTTLRSEPRVGRLLLRRLVDPVTLADALADPTDISAFVEWEASLSPALREELLAGLVPLPWAGFFAPSPAVHLVASPRGSTPLRIPAFAVNFDGRVRLAA